jgi:phage protein D
MVVSLASSARQPRAYLNIEGVNLQVRTIGAHLSTLAKADTFTAEIPMDSLPQDLSLDRFATGGPLAATVMATTDIATAAPQPLVLGNITQVEFNWTERYIRVGGKDAVAEMLRATSREKFQNRKGHEIIKEIAARHNFFVDVTDDMLLSGKYYQIDWAHLTNQSEWAVINRVADSEGHSVHLDSKSKTIVVRPLNEDSLPLFTVHYTPPTPASYASGEFIDLRIVRNFEIASETHVRHKSWHTKQKKVVHTHKVMSGNGGKPVNYDYRAPNMTQEQSSRAAERHLLNNTRHEFGVDIELPGDTSFAVRSRIKLTGTGTKLDQVYYVDTVDHTFSFEQGYRMTIAAKGALASRKVSTVHEANPRPGLFVSVPDSSLLPGV